MEPESTDFDLIEFQQLARDSVDPKSSLSFGKMFAAAMSVAKSGRTKSTK